ncbi:MAG: hypothetical protein HY269_01550, partial [Deltaproteobacteria bacterium]|nr:hypothetical protein [Deltaproteobacteria bacterium]
MNSRSTAVARAIRPFTPDDIPQVAELYRRVFLQPTGASSASASDNPSAQIIERAFAEIFFDNPWYDEELSASVYSGADGRIAGFLGVTARRMLFNQRPIRAAVSAHFMTQPAGQNQLAGVQLLKAFFNGPQDLSLTDGANNTGRRVWEGLGGVTVPAYSFYWQRVLRPSEFALTRVAAKLPGLAALRGLTRPLCHAVDAYLKRRMPHRFFFVTPQAETANLDVETLLKGLADCAASDLLRPDYDETSLAWLLNRAKRIRQTGLLQQAAVHNAQRALLGWYLYYLQPGGESRVLQLAARR